MKNVSLNWVLGHIDQTQNVIGVGTLQISDDSLEKMGYDKSKNGLTRQTKQEKTLVSFITLWFKMQFPNPTCMVSF